jgi:hypothetical protein
MGQSSYRAWKNWAAGDFLVGKYVSESVDQFGNPNYKVEVIEASFGDKNNPKVGSLFTFNSSGALKKSFSEISEGDIVKVIYKGVEPAPGGKFKGKPTHMMTVMVAPASQADSLEITSDDLI